LELNVPTRLTFKVVNVAIKPPLTLAANLIVQLDPSIQTFEEVQSTTPNWA